MPRTSKIRRQPMYVNDVQELANSLVEQVFSYEHGFIEEETKGLIIANQALGGTMNAFVFHGALHACVPQRTLRGIVVKPLHPSLEDRGERLLSRKTRVDRDHRRITNSLAVVTVKCRSRQDIRDALPETLVNLVPELSQIDRLREEGCLISDNQMLLKQFQDSVTLLLDYQANRLIY